MPEIAKDLGELKSLVFSWQAKKSLIGALNVFKKDYLNLAGDIKTTDANGLISVFTPASSQVESGKNVAARLVRTYSQ